MTMVMLSLAFDAAVTAVPIWLLVLMLPFLLLFKICFFPTFDYCVCVPVDCVNVCIAAEGDAYNFQNYFVFVRSVPIKWQICVLSFQLNENLLFHLSNEPEIVCYISDIH